MQRLLQLAKAFSLVPGFIAAMVFMASAQAQIDVEFNEDERHHFSVVVAGTYVDHEDETAFTIGGDYEYRINRLLGVGFVVERAFGELDATSVLAVADIHIWKGLAIQTGPGIEFRHGEETAIGRIGGLYEYEFGEGYTFSPQLHYDFGEEDALVFGFAVGRAF